MTLSGETTMKIPQTDTEFQDDTIKSVDDNAENGWGVTGGSGWSLFIPNELCKQTPKPGESYRLYGRGIGYAVRGIVIGGRVYRYETPAEHEVSQQAMRERLTREREESDRKFRESQKPKLPEFSTSDPDGWAACVATNSTDGYSFECCRYAAAWAATMEREMAKGATVPDIAEKCASEADTSGITGFMYGAAVAMLAKFWVHGDKLRRWHNKETQVGDEGDKANESGGVLNPALLNIG